VIKWEEILQYYKNYKLISNSLFVKAANIVPRELLEKFEIPTTPIIYRRVVEQKDLAKHLKYKIKYYIMFKNCLMLIYC